MYEDAFLRAAIGIPLLAILSISAHYRGKADEYRDYMTVAGRFLPRLVG